MKQNFKLFIKFQLLLSLNLKRITETQRVTELKMIKFAELKIEAKEDGRGGDGA